MKNVTFITTTLNPPFAKVSRSEVKKFFPNSNHLLVDGNPSMWPLSWFYWLDLLPEIKTKYYCFLDDDAFVCNRGEFEKAIELMDNENVHLYGISDAWHPWRAFNPVAVNPFFMLGNTEFTVESLKKNIRAKFNKAWYDELLTTYPFQKDEKIDIQNDYEPFYCFFWSLKENGGKFKYFYPEFDEVNKGTNPKIDKNSPCLANHLWYSRAWSSSMDVFGVRNDERYKSFMKKYGIEL